MCRCYVSPDNSSIEREFEPVGPQWKFAANFNTAPGQPVPVIRVIDGIREGVLLRWGVGKQDRFNTGVETIASAADSRRPWKRGHRCIIPALGFYEWHVNPDGGKQPYYIHVDDQDVLGFAGLWVRSRADANSVTECCTLITLPANSLMAEIDNAKARMPAILKREQRDSWLMGTAEAAGAALSAYDGARMLAYAVSDRIDSPGNNDETLLEPLETDVD
jgi:putative SOS response-associated peptidase YedK